MASPSHEAHSSMQVHLGLTGGPRDFLCAVKTLREPCHWIFLARSFLCLEHRSGTEQNSSATGKVPVLRNSTVATLDWKIVHLHETERKAARPLLLELVWLRPACFLELDAQEVKQEMNTQLSGTLLPMSRLEYCVRF